MVPTVKNRIKYLAAKWYRKVKQNENKDIQDFIAERVWKPLKGDKPTPLELIIEEYNRQESFNNPSQ